MYKKMDNITKIFIEEPEKEFHVREIAKITGRSPTTISKYLNSMKKEGLLLSKKVSNHLFFRSRTDNIQYKMMKKDYNLKKIISSGLISYIEEHLNNPEAIILFGSFAKGEDIQKSDIDIAVISPIKKELSLEGFENKLKHNIQLFLFSKKDIDKMKTKNKELLNNIINGIVVNGFWEVFR